MTIHRIDDVLAALDNSILATIRPWVDGDDPGMSFVQEHDKLCTGVVRFGKNGGFAFNLSPPIQLKAGVRYFIQRRR